MPTLVHTAVVLLAVAYANENGRATRPVMGWRSWEYVGVNITGTEMNLTIDAIALKRSLAGEQHPVSLLDLGYTDVAIDDGWQPPSCTTHAVPGAINGGFHTARGEPIVDGMRFPGGFAGFVHRAKRHPPMTFSWYTNNCECAERNYSSAEQIHTHYKGDVEATVSSGMSGVKVDG